MWQRSPTLPEWSASFRWNTRVSNLFLFSNMSVWAQNSKNKPNGLAAQPMQLLAVWMLQKLLQLTQYCYLFFPYSYYNWKTQVSTSNSSPNFEVIYNDPNGLLFKNARDKKILNVDPLVGCFVVVVLFCFQAPGRQMVLLMRSVHLFYGSKNIPRKQKAHRAEKLFCAIAWRYTDVTTLSMYLQHPVCLTWTGNFLPLLSPSVSCLNHQM